MVVKRLTEGTETWSATSADTCTSAEITYLVFGAETKKAAVDAVLADAPSDYYGMYLKEVRFEEYTDDGDIELSAVYATSDTSSSSSDEEEEETPTMSFECSTGSMHVTTAIAQTRKYGTKDAGMAIGWNGKSGEDSEVAGVDIPTAQLRETYTQTISSSKFTNDYKRKLAGVVSKVNSTAFKGWYAGEVMFMGWGYTAPTDDDADVTVTFNFSIQMNETKVAFAGQTIDAKKGFEYIWVINKSKTDTTGIPSNEVEAIYVAQVCKTADFGVLGLGA